MELRLRLPLSLLAGITTCKCGAHMDPFGDHALSCVHFESLKTPGHNLIQEVVASMSSCANFRVTHDSRRPRAVSHAYSPNWCPDLTLLHGSDHGSHVLIDVTTTSVVAQQCMPGSSRQALLASRGAESRKRAVYGNVAPHVVLPFVVEHAGALGLAAMQHFRRCRRIAVNQLSPQLDEVSTWSSRGFSNYFLASVSVANCKGLGHFFMSAASILRSI